MSIQVCAAEVLRVATDGGIQVPKEEINDILKSVKRKIDGRGAVDGETELQKLILEAQTEISTQAKVNAAIKKRNALINARVYGKVMTALKADPDNPQRVLSAIMVGDARRGLFSVDAQQKAILLDHAQGLVAELKRHDNLDIFKSGDLDGKIYQEMFDGLGSSGNKEARQIAEAIQKVQTRMLKRKNRAGANIRELSNYVVRQNHDPLLLRGKGLEQDKTDWVNFVKERIDAKKTYMNKPEDMSEDEFLGNMYDNLVSGNHMKSDGIYGQDGSLDPLGGYKGYANLAKKMSAERLIHFKNGEAAFQYANKFSRQPLREAVYSGLSHDAQNIGLIETFGTNPKAMFDRILKDAPMPLKAKPKLFERFSEKALRNQFAELDGTTRAIGAGVPILGTSVTWSGIASGLRAFQAMSKLGMATISSFSDIATKAAFINSNTERGVFGAYATALRDTFRIFNSQEQKELALLLNIGVENELAELHSRFSANDSAPGQISKAQQIFFKLNGMQWWNHTQKVGVARMLAADLANYTKKDFSQVPASTQRLLGLYNIGETEWPLFRDLDLTMADGRQYLTTDIIDSIDNQKIDPIIRDLRGTLDVTDDMRQQYKDELRTKIGAYYSDSADTAIPTPGARERAIMNQGTERGTVLGEAVRMMMQLKGFPITYVTKGIGRQLESGGKLGVAKMMLGTTAMGYISVATKDILKGKEPQEVFSDDFSKSKDAFIRAFTQGGGAGIYGDFIFGEFNRYGQSPLETFAGPTLGTAGDVLKLWAKFRDGDDAAGDAAQLMLRNTPFINLFYGKLAVDYLFAYELTEFVNPGYFKRMERRMKKDTDQEFFFPPSQYVR